MYCRKLLGATWNEDNCSYKTRLLGATWMMTHDTSHTSWYINLPCILPNSDSNSETLLWRTDILFSLRTKCFGLKTTCFGPLCYMFMLWLCPKPRFINFSVWVLIQQSGHHALIQLVANATFMQQTFHGAPCGGRGGRQCKQSLYGNHM